MKPETRISQADLSTLQCAGYHSGSHDLTRVSGGKYAECCGCLSTYTALQCYDALEGRTNKELGQGGVRKINN